MPTQETPQSGGTRANRTGNVLEKTVLQLLEQHGYTPFWDHKKQLFANREAVGGKQYARHVSVGPTIYESERIVDFLVINKDKFPNGLVIECKWQQSSGSVDEKYPFLVFNIYRTGVPTIILLDGGGYKKTAEAWLRAQAGEEKAMWKVFNMTEFITAVNNGLLG